MRKKFAALSFSVALALGGVMALLWLLRLPIIQAASYTVCPAGPPACNYSTIQDAVDAASDGDVIQVAAATYTGFQGRAAPAWYPNPPASGVVTQVVYISKSVTIRGGYTTAFTDPPDPEANQTTLNAQGRGRVLFISGDVGPTIEGLRITGGDAAGLGGGGNPWWNDAGGGVYVISATATINNNRVFSNTADLGGGLYLWYSDTTLDGNTVISNTATWSGGGLYLWHSDATLNGNTVISNTATWAGSGGGLFLWDSDATLNDNTIISNTATWAGGGLFLSSSDATLSGNIVISNTATSLGGGLYLWDSDATLSGNFVIANTAGWYGGGLYLVRSEATLNGNTVIANTAYRDGGGLFLEDSDATLINTVVTDNRADTAGSGLYIRASSPPLLHTTIARNSGGDGSGVHVTDDGWGHHSTVALTNTILASHTVGIIVTAGNTATLESTLWHGNTPNWAGAGTINRSHDYSGDPRFDVDGYRLMAGSAAIDKGLDAGVTVDIDGETRPFGSGYDLGADEFAPALSVTKQASPDPVEAGSQLTYTLRVINTGYVDLHATVTDILPAHVMPTGTRTWMPITLPAPGGVWTQTVVVTVEMGYTGPLTNVVQVTTDEGATGMYMCTVHTAGKKLYLPIIMKNTG